MRARPALAAALAAVCLSIGAYAQDRVEGSFQRTLTVSGSADLDVSTGSGNISIQEGAADRVEITARIRVGRDRDRSTQEAEELVRRLEANPPVEQTGNTVRIGNITDRDLQRNVSISYEIRTPAGSSIRSRTGSGDQSISGAGAVEANTGSGDIVLTNVGPVRVQTGSGDLAASGISGAFHGRTGSGQISVRASTLTDAEASAGSGDIQIADIRGPFRARTGSGDISAEGEATEPWDLQTGSGDVRILLPQTASFELNVQTGSGQVHLNHPLQIQGAIDRRRLSGAVRGGGPLLALRTGSGDIRID